MAKRSKDPSLAMLPAAVDPVQFPMSAHWSEPTPTLVDNVLTRFPGLTTEQATTYGGLLQGALEQTVATPGAHPGRAFNLQSDGSADFEFDVLEERIGSILSRPLEDWK